MLLKMKRGNNYVELLESTSVRNLFMEGIYLKAVTEKRLKNGNLFTGKTDGQKIN